MLAGAAAAAVAGLAAAQTGQLVSGPGSGLTTAKCGTCHDVTHITRSKLTRDEWVDNLRNMVQRGMPPPTDEESRIILDYLVAYYSPSPAPPAAPDTHADAAAKASGIAGGDKVGQLLTSAACVACHAADKPLVGPSFRSVAARYRGDTAAPARLAQKIRAGGVGAWGTTPMPPNAGLSDPDLKQLVDWILAQQ
jgi:cytochrome c